MKTSSILFIGLIVCLISTFLSFKFYYFHAASFLAFLLIPFLLITLLVSLWKKEKTRVVGTTLLAFLAIPLFITELVVKYGFKTFETYYEKSTGGNKFYSPYTVINTNPYLNYYPNSVVGSNQSEFDYEHIANELGFFSKNPNEVDKSKPLIACFGDSFTQGIGSPMDSTWPAATGAYLSNFEVINAGLQGSDPIYAIKFFKEIVGPNYNPDVILFAVNDTDPNEVMLRGGFERFHEDGSVHYISPPWWEPLYGISHIARAIVHSQGYDGYFLHRDEANDKLLQANSLIYDEFLRLKKELSMEFPNTQIVFIVHPLKGELTNGEFRNTLNVRLQEGGGRVIDVLELMKQDNRINPQSLNKYYWELDGHHTSKGYWIMGELIAQELQSILKEFSVETK